MLYRTIANLAFFFDISVDTLFEETPLSLWEYTVSQPHYSKPCLGRDWEIQQLQQLYALADHTQQTVCITGMQGLGKTHLINHFLSQIQFSSRQCTDRHTLYVSMDPSDDALPLLSRQMLGVAIDASDSAIRNKAKTLAISSFSFLHLLTVLGVKLNEAEKNALSALSVSRLQELEKLTVLELIQSCTENDISVIAIDDLQYAESNHLNFIKTLVNNNVCSPFFLVLGTTNIKQFTFLPEWLAFTHKIDLKPLDNSATTVLAKILMSTQQLCPEQHQQRKKIAIERSKGHPGILEELLMSKGSVSNFPNDFHTKTLLTLRTLSIEQRQLLKVLAFLGTFFSITLVDRLLSKMLLKGIVHLHSLVCLGFLYPMSDGYCFRHFLIWEIVMKQINNAEKRQWQALSQEITSKQIPLVSDP